MKNQLKVEITEMFVAKPDKDRVFFGCIKRSRNEKGEMNLFSRIAMPDHGVLCANETDQLVLAKNLNSMAVMILDNGLHKDAGVSSDIFGLKFYHN
jgi:hypothetical protein